MPEIFSPLVGVAFWIFVAAVVVAGIWYAAARDKEKQKTIRLAIEKGVPLDAAAIESLDRTKRIRAEDFFIGGWLTIVGGIALIVFGLFL